MYKYVGVWVCSLVDVEEEKRWSLLKKKKLVWMWRPKTKFRQVDPDGSHVCALVDWFDNEKSKHSQVCRRSLPTKRNSNVGQEGELGLI